MRLSKELDISRESGYEISEWCRYEKYMELGKLPDELVETIHLWRQTGSVFKDQLTLEFDRLKQLFFKLAINEQWYEELQISDDEQVMLVKYLNQIGLVVQSEVEYLEDGLSGFRFDWESMLYPDSVINEMIWSQPEARMSNKVTLGEAIASMEREKKEGKRVVVVMGGFDVGTPGQKEILKEAEAVAGEFGSVYVLVASDSIVNTVKGSHRPYEGINKRASRVVESGCVDVVAEVSFSNTLNVESVIRLYNQLHQSLKGKVHLRVHGEGPKDDIWFQTYDQQTRSADIQLLISGLSRTTSATEIGKELFS